MGKKNVAASALKSCIISLLFFFLNYFFWLTINCLLRNFYILTFGPFVSRFEITSWIFKPPLASFNTFFGARYTTRFSSAPVKVHWDKAHQEVALESFSLCFCWIKETMLYVTFRDGEICWKAFASTSTFYMSYDQCTAKPQVICRMC